MKFAFKLVVVAAAALIGLVLRQIYVARARARLAAIDAGERCVACSGSSLEKSESIVRCLECGYEANLENLRGSQPTKEELDRIFTPEKRGFWD